MRNILFIGGVAILSPEAIVAIGPHKGADGLGAALYLPGTVIVVPETPTQVLAALHGDQAPDQAPDQAADQADPPAPSLDPVTAV